MSRSSSNIIKSSAPGDSITVSGSRLTITMTGDGAFVMLNGSPNDATVGGDGAAANMAGGDNSLTGTGSGMSVFLSGSDNDVTIKGSLSAVSDLDTGNSIALKGDHDLAGLAGSNGCIAISGSSDFVHLQGTDNTAIVKGDHASLLDVGTGDTIDLVISVIGKHESVTVASWFDQPDSHVGTIRTADGFSVSDAGVDQLVQAMSAFSSPSSFGHWHHHSQGEANALAPALAANWQHS